MKFIHFGCWNENKCNPDDKNLPINGVSAVVKSLLEKKDPEIQFYVIAGDNYYPQEKNGNKIFDYNNFKSGFDCLLRIIEENQKPIFLLMGNHDLVHKKDIKYEDKPVNIPRCLILEKQLSYIKYFDVKSIHKFLEKQKTLLLFLNTTLYEENIKEENTLECQQLYRSDYPSDIKANLESLIDFEERVLLNLVLYFLEKYELKNIILIGHHPIYSVKYKKKTDSDLKTSSFNYRGLNFLDELLSKFHKEINKYYLCADIHHYQLGKLQLNNHNITQIVVGTGGTYCDEINTEVLGVNSKIDTTKLPMGNVLFPDETEEKGIYLCLTVQDIQAKFGYLECEISDESNDFSYQFQSVKDCEYDKKDKKKNKKKDKKVGGKKIKTFKKGKSINRSKKRTQ